MPIPVRLSIIKGLLAIFMIATVAFTWPLWVADRYYPLFPGLEALPAMHTLVSYLMPILLLVCLTFVLVLRKPRLFVFLALVLCAVLLVLDTGRIHYWFYFYFLLLVLLFGYNWRVDNINHYASFYNGIRILLALVYVVAAIQHFNSSFIQQAWPQFIKPFERFWTPEQCAYLLKIAYAVPVIELFIALGFFIGPTRMFAISFAIVFHLFSVVVLFLQPQTESAVVLWHFFMVSIVVLAFAGSTGAQKNYGFSFSLYPAFALLVFAIGLPVLVYSSNRSLQNRLDLMQANTHVQYIYVDPASREKLPLYIQSFAMQRQENYYKLCVTSWVMHETRTRQILGTDHLIRLSAELSRNYGADALVDLPPEDLNGALALK